MQRLEFERLTEDNGFGLPQPPEDDWAVFTGLTCPYRLWIARLEPRWLVGLAHDGVMAELGSEHGIAPLRRPDGGTTVAVDELGPILRRLLRLVRSLPTAPLDRFLEQIRSLPTTTEEERLAVERIGQDVFKDALLDYWGAACPLSGVTHPRLLRASHIKPWAACETDAERLDVHNGLLLAAHLDAAFDAGLISFADDGKLLVSATLSRADRARLRLDQLPALRGLLKPHMLFLRGHRATVFRAADASPLAR